MLTWQRRSSSEARPPAACSNAATFCSYPEAATMRVLTWCFVLGLAAGRAPMSTAWTLTPAPRWRWRWRCRWVNMMRAAGLTSVVMCGSTGHSSC
jgi:hypothetical protein